MYTFISSNSDDLSVIKKLLLNQCFKIREVKRMNKKGILLFWIGFIALVLIEASIVYLRQVLVPSLEIITPIINTISIILIPLFIIAGLSHIFILFTLLKKIVKVEKNLWIHSLSIVLTILSGILLLVDVVLLLEIGKEYLFFDVSNEWVMINIHTAIHFLTIGLAYFVLRKKVASVPGFFEEIEKGSEQMFLGMYQVMFFSSLFGILGILFVMINVMDSVTFENYNLEISIISSILALTPIIIFLMYWIVRFRKVPVRDWLNEYEFLITVKAMIYSLVIGWIVSYLGFKLTVKNVDFPILIWLLFTFFAQLLMISSYIIVLFNIPEPD
jgi:hypothetical protein